jgi:glycosyltransferase involved in cell wall biosynthesis
MYAYIADAAAMLPTEQQVEILFVNDGSKDKSAEILAELAASDSRVRPVSKPNGGIASARNAGLDRASGDFICFVDQDDIMHPDMLSVLYADLVKSGADFVQAKADVVTAPGVAGKNADPVSGVGCGEKAGRTRETTAAGSLAAKRTAQSGRKGNREEDALQYRLVERETGTYAQYLKTLVMRGLVQDPDCEVSGSVWCCMFRTEFLRENNISFYCFCDYEDDWIFLILAMVHAERFCIEPKTVYSWVVRRDSESHGRAAKDRYLEDFYEKHKLLRAFFWEALKQAHPTSKEAERFDCELQKQALLWSLSNETGRGIQKHTEQESVDIMTHVVETEKGDGICRRINRHPLYISVAGTRGWKRCYYALRDKLLTFLLLHGQIALAVRLNRRVFHGRWHI